MKYNTGSIVAVDVGETFLDDGIALAYASKVAKSHFTQ